VTVHYTDAFKRQLKRLARKYRQVRADLEPLIEQLQAGETPGEQIQGVSYAMYKVRLRNSDAQRGTSGGYRVVYYVVRPDDTLLVTVYSKSEQDDIDAETIARIINQASPISSK